MDSISVSIPSLVLSFSLVLVAMGISYKEKLGLNKDIIISMARMIIQLIIVGYVLTFIFNLNLSWVTILVILFMVVNAAWNARRRAEAIPHAFRISLISLLIGVIFSLVILVLTGAIDFVPSQLIPINGMLVGNGMNVIGLSYRNLNQAYNHSYQVVNERLALGATPKLASKTIIRQAIKDSLQPTIDTARTVGLVLLPGMMTGMIMAGLNPMSAIMYQILIYFMMMSTGTITSCLAVYQSYKYFFNDSAQLVPLNSNDN
ncbi:ABC transporter permease [Aerococcus suis]|uniref:Putative ABC transport system permease protein n=1 Tax=Aerococcus suis TaxID=371602 RepID=A0A1W1Y6L0_9LACT|nr:putative ABC transport system permease protein [Aerococcus suis]